MRKDYLPASVETVAADDASFVERYWTEMWRDRAMPDLSAVARQEEHRVMRPFLAGRMLQWDLPLFAKDY